MQIHKEVDASGLNCPLPILKTKKALADMSSGEILRVISTDPGSVMDFQAFTRQTGNELLQSSQEGDNFVFVLRRR
jgi:TusA-related sulfurtransferase